MPSTYGEPLDLISRDKASDYVDWSSHYKDIYDWIVYFKDGTVITSVKDEVKSLPSGGE